MSAENWDKYTIAYKNAGDILLEKLLKRERPFHTQFAIIYLYRHYIELMLKEIILNNREFIDEKYIFPVGHNIYNLWKDCRKFLEATDAILEPEYTKSQNYRDDTLKAYDVLGERLNKFAQLDPDSERFRYPVDKKGNPREIDQKSLSELLNELPELIKQISDTLEGISLGSYQILQDKYEGLEEERRLGY
jgi:hypothetical protein